MFGGSRCLLSCLAMLPPGFPVWLRSRNSRRRIGDRRGPNHARTTRDDACVDEKRTRGNAP
eukprot:8400246-Lingulodinium_polyedra.AAC.1